MSHHHGVFRGLEMNVVWPYREWSTRQTSRMSATALGFLRRVQAQARREGRRLQWFPNASALRRHVRDYSHRRWVRGHGSFWQYSR